MQRSFSLLTTVFFLAAAALHAQSFFYGFKGGINKSTVGGADAEFTIPILNQKAQPETRINFAGGIMVQWEFLGLFALRGEVLYSPKSVRYSKDISLPSIPIPGITLPGSVNLTMDVNATYVEIPVALELLPPVPIPLHPSLYAGASLGVLVDHSEDLNTNLAFPGVAVPTPEFHLKNLDPSILFGGGFRYDFPVKISLGLDVRYTIGLHSAVDSVSASGSTLIDHPDIRNHTLSVMGTILFKI